MYAYSGGVPFKPGHKPYNRVGFTPGIFIPKAMCHEWQLRRYRLAAKKRKMVFADWIRLALTVQCDKDLPLLAEDVASDF